MYGIGATDANPTAGGAKYAFDNGWFTPAEAIKGFERLLVCPLDIGRILICSRFIWIEAHLVQRVLFTCVVDVFDHTDDA
ncbi:hypothetical protein ACW7EJ_20475, partial [Acinetobacter soli]